MLRKNCFTILLLLFIILAGIVFFAGCQPYKKFNNKQYVNLPYIASKSSKKFHDRDCFLGKRIDPADAVYFSYREDAINAGYKPCIICRP